LLIAAALLLGLAVLKQFYSSEVPPINLPSLSSAGQPQIAPATLSPEHVPSLSGSVPKSPSSDPATPLLQEAIQLMNQNQLDAALGKVKAALQVAPKNADAYGLRGNIYAEKKLWDLAAKDYQTALQFNGKNVRVKFNLAEIEFKQKEYDAARPGFAALTQDSTMGDLAAYKVFLCDLFGGHEHVAVGELDAFNQVGSNASYYFANVAWSVYHQKTEDARGWLESARRIYTPKKFSLYAASLRDLGYMPLPPPPPSGP